MRDRIQALKSIPIDRLRGFQGGNPKSHNDADRVHLEASLQNHGYVLPVAVRALEDGTFEIIDGHSRVEVIISQGDTDKIKAIVLDVDSVAEGRRILLALQRHSGFDMDKLEQFIGAAIADGTAAADLMVDTGFTGSELDAFATASEDFVKDITEGNIDPKTPEPSIKEGVSRAGLTPEHVQFAVALTREQSEIVHGAMKLAKQLSDRKVAGDALEVICAFYLESKRDEQPVPITKKKRAK